MIKKKAILILNDSEYEILRCSYTFARDVDGKGRPTTGVHGGDIRVVLESGEDSPILSQMLIDTVPMVKGAIELLAGEDEACIRRIAFEQAYVYSHSEVMQTRSGSPLTTEISISPLRLDINERVRLDRRWPETVGFHWQEYKEEEKKYAKNETVEKNAKIVEAYWIDKKNKKQMDLLIDYPVKLYIVLKDFTVGVEGKFHFEDVDNEGWGTADYSGVVNKDGIVEIENFQLIIKK